MEKPMNPYALRVSTYTLLTMMMTMTGLDLNRAQAQPSAEFEVASVKPNRMGNAGVEGSEREKITVSPNGITMRNVSLRSCIRWTYGVRDYQISGPGWISSRRYDIAANAPGPVSVPDLKLMMQKLLSDRFKLTLRRESKDLPIYAMVTGKKGTKMKPASGGDGGMLPTDGALVFRNYSMPELAERLGARPFKLDRLVLDKTGLEGAFDFEIKFGDNAAEMKHTLEGMEQGGADQGTSIFTILQEQLGLSFKAQKAPVESLIVERAEMVPTEN